MQVIKKQSVKKQNRRASLKVRVDGHLLDGELLMGWLVPEEGSCAGA